MSTPIYSTVYRHLTTVIFYQKKKLDLCAFISGVSREMDNHAELLWWRALRRNGWNLYPKTEEGPFAVSKYKGIESNIKNDIDFIVEKDGITYGVEIKKFLNLEPSSPSA